MQVCTPLQTDNHASTPPVGKKQKIQTKPLQIKLNLIQQNQTCIHNKTYDNTKLTQMQLHFTHSNQWQQMKWSQSQHTASSAMPIFRWDLTISNFLFSISVCSLSGKLYTSSVILKACHRQNDIETRHRQSPSHSVTLQALELTLSTFKCQLKCQVCQLRNHLFQH